MGENGTGKEILAQLLHYYSPRSKNTMITINWGAIPSEMVESELFGHEKGAFTGANDRKEGAFELIRNPESGYPVKDTINHDNVIQIPIGMSLEEIEYQGIQQTLNFVENNKTEAAKILGSSRKTLHNKLDKYEQQK